MAIIINNSRLSSLQNLNDYNSRYNDYASRTFKS